MPWHSRRTSSPPDLIPASVIAGRTLAAQGNTRKAAKILEKAWKLSPHPDIAEVYGAARIGDSPRDRLKRVRSLVQRRPDSVEGPVAIARAAIDARIWDQARESLQPLLDDRPQSRVCMMMAEIENGERGDKGRVREWLARAVNAPRDPMWTADGYASDTWAPVSPVSGRLDAFEWKVPVEGVAFHGAAELFEVPEDIPDELQQAEPAGTAAIDDEIEPDVVTIEAEIASEDTVDAGDTTANTEDADDAKATADHSDAVDADPEPENQDIRQADPEEKTVDGDDAVDVPAPVAAEPDKKSVSVKDVTSGGAGDADEPIIFVPPRAPDDPGPDGELETDESRRS